MRIRNLIRLLAGILSIAFVFMPSGGALASDDIGEPHTWTFGGHFKYQYIDTWKPEDSLFQRFSPNDLRDHNLEARLKLVARHNRWDFKTDVQLIYVHSDTLAGSRSQSLPFSDSLGVINDDRRLFDLTHYFKNRNKDATVLRLDRANIGYMGDKTVIRVGRQAISWGNGLLFTPMDIFNPFNPTVVDKEYKTGDDMLYGQYLMPNGSDFQVVAVARRDQGKDKVEKNEASLALKYHGFWGRSEYDFLLAGHYGQAVFGAGVSMDIGGAIWRGDLLWNDTDSGSVYTAVGGVSYSGIVAGHNWSGALEYYYNGFGIPDGVYSPSRILANPGLRARLSRGELFNLGRHYLGASMRLEASPLLSITPNIFVNLIDPSVLTQMVISYDWKQNVQLLAAINVPIGKNGTEYGGIRALHPGQYVSIDVSFFAQFAWYF